MMPLCIQSIREASVLDLSSAFDTVDHDTLLSVLNCRFSVDGLALDLAGRTQTFQYNTQKSGPHTVTCSVPQGSISPRTTRVHCLCGGTGATFSQSPDAR